MIEDFIIENPVVSLPGRQLDFEKIVGLPEKEFADLYLELMTEYKDKDGWWKSKDKMPYCSLCNSKIEGPATLRRFDGRTLDPECFSKVYQKERKEKKVIMQQYWDRVAKLVLDS